ncbi:MAG: outer membrane beta-barrel protein [Verrucomicrobiia bacterium]
MKKFIASVGLIAAGTVGLQAAYAPGLDSMAASKIWSVAGTLRGFYDSNYQTASSNARGSIGFEVSPEVDINVALQQTELGLRYTYGMYYYQDRQNLGENPIDQTHQVDLWLDHAFTERWQTKVMDTFVIGQEPELIDPSTSLATRTEGNNIRNTGTIDLNTIWTRLFSTKLSYVNNYFDYQNSGTTPANFTAQGASLAGQYNRIDQLVSLDLQWDVAPETVAFVGGAFDWVNYTGNEPIAEITPTSFLYSDSRNSRSYFGYVGAQHNFLANLSFTGKVGVQYTDNYNNQPSGTTSVNPYADLSMIYTYLPGSYAQVGFTQTENASDQVGAYSPNASNGSISLFSESSTIYASINQRLTPKVTGTAIGRWQHSVFSGGQYNSQSQDYYSFGANLSYAFNPHISAEAGYNLDYLQSNIPGNQYSRNRVYVGVSAAY